MSAFQLCLYAANQVLPHAQPACAAALDMGQHLIRRERLAVPQGARDVFTLLAQAWLVRRIACGLPPAHGGLS